MEVEYELNIDDVIAYTTYSYNHLPLLKRNAGKQRIQYIVPAAIFALLAIVTIIHKDYSWTIGSFVGFIIIILLYLFYPYRLRKNIVKLVTEQYSQGPNDVIGMHKLTITPEYLLDMTKMGEDKIGWESIERVDLVDNYVFIVKRASLSAYVVPSKAFSDNAAFLQFADNAKAYLNKYR